MADQINTPINYPVIAGGKIVVGGKVLFGNENQRPDEDNPATLKAIFVDSNLTIQAQNPQPLGSNGEFDQSVNGTLYGPDNAVYSVLILDRKGKELSYTPSFNLSDTSAATSAAASAAAAAASESNAAASESAAAAIGIEVANSYVDFVNRYFGAFASDPSVDPAGNPPNEGSIYFNTVSDVFFTWNGSAWINYFPSNPNGLLVTATGTTTARTLADWAEKEILSYNSIADAKADTKLDIGRRVKTFGYYSTGDGGGAEYVVVSGGTGTDDGGSYHDLANGNQLKLIHSKKISVKVFGATGDNISDDSTPLKNTLSFVNTLSGVMYFPVGVYIYNAPDALIITESIEVHGEGERSKINWLSDTGTENLWDFVPASAGFIDTFTIKDLFICGTHQTNTSINEVYPLIVYNVSKVTIKNVRVQYSRIFGITVRSASEVYIDGCNVSNCAKDGINAANCDFVSLTNNSVSFIDDDALAIHNQYHSDQRTHVITGNKLKFCQGIKCLGVHNVSITGNALDFIFGGAITVRTQSSALEGEKAAFGVVISGNIVSNFFNRAAIDGLSSNSHAIFLSSGGARAGTLTAIPGQVTPSGTFDLPYEYYRNQEDDLATTTPIPNSSGFVIVGNTFRRDIPHSGMLSAIGKGVFWTRAGDTDLDLSQPNAMSGAVIKTEENVSNVVFSSNVIEGVAELISASSTTVLTNWNVHGNICTDIKTILIQGSGSNVHSIYFDNNIFDLDPYHANTGRSSNGSWSSLGDATAFVLQGNRGVHFSNNIFRNLSRITDVDFDNAYRDGIISSSNDIIEAYPVAYKFSTSNIGVGYVPKQAVSYRVIQANPSLGNYGDFLNDMLASSNQQPSSGYYLSSHFVRDKANALTGSGASRKMTYGWLRLTTGSAHTTGVDWEVIYLDAPA